MRHRLLPVKFSNRSLMTVRERSRQIGELFGLETLQRTRMGEVASEAAQYRAPYRTLPTAPPAVR